MNNIFINNNDIDGLHFGSSSVSKVYFGSNLVYEDTPTPPTPPTPTTNEYLNFTAINGDATIGTSGSATPNVSYSFDKNTWTTWNYSNLTIPNGTTVYMKGTNTTMNNKKFTMSGTVEANGNIMSLLYGDNFEGQLTIPSNSCFEKLFSGCTSLTTAPELPATTLEAYCYDQMFKGCSNLVAAPELPATTLAIRCYQYMFEACTSLTSAPTILPATTLQSNCYEGMFCLCSSLTTAPVLPALSLVGNCYYALFRNCTNLNYIKAMFTTTPSSSYTSQWVQGVQTTSGTFVKNSAATWNVSGNEGVPNNWTIQTASS